MHLKHPRQLRICPPSSPEAITRPSAEEDEDNPISDLRSRLFSRKNNGVAIPAVKREYAVVNIMELLVSDRLDSAFSKFHCCQVRQMPQGCGGRRTQPFTAGICRS